MKEVLLTKDFIGFLIAYLNQDKYLILFRFLRLAFHKSCKQWQKSFG
ncbi:unnamed protein product [Paramecium octaurelia]|uniref:Uncharacterized protein n=1 Tax=Paramecium octaurelia TaxID=43137 RepID=A0A8S1T411_PAROT|nr:unnamed protein product [Paramecium octaurelia]